MNGCMEGGTTYFYIVVLQDGIAMKLVDLVKDFKNKTILNK
jgi:hypothetical protein